MVSILAHPYSILLGCLVLGGLFLFSGLGKALGCEGTTRTVVAYNVLPGFLAMANGLILPWAEMLLARLLLAGLLTRLVAFGLSLLLLRFAIAKGVNLARGQQMDCGCLRRAARECLGWETLARSALLLAVATGVAAWDGSQRALGAFVTPDSYERPGLERYSLFVASWWIGSPSSTYV